MAKGTLYKVFAGRFYMMNASATGANDYKDKRCFAALTV